VPIEQIVVLVLGLVVIAALAGLVAWTSAQATSRGVPDREPSPRQAPRTERDLGASDEAQDVAAWPSTVRALASAGLVPGVGHQVGRVVALLFLASVAVVVAVTGAWPGSEAAIFTLLAAGMLLVVFFTDLLPAASLGQMRRFVEGIGAVAFLGVLMGLTGGIGSPFVVGFYLVVAGTALSSEGLAPLAVALLAATTLAVVSFVASSAQAIEPTGLAWMGVNAVTLVLLADLAAASARAKRQAHDQALRASRFDVLTGLFNRSFFFTTMEQEIRRSERMGRGFTMLMLDLDDLKPVNDTFGHQWGDRLLTAVADILRRTVRFTDTVARYGGDEFLILLPETDGAGGYIVAETIRRDIAGLSLRAADRNVRSSVSIGLVTYPDDGTTMEQLVAAADVAMYESKRRGKNQIVGYRTRTDRVATAIPVTPAELVSLDQAARPGDARPWVDSGASRSIAVTSSEQVPVASVPQPAPPPRPAAPGGREDRAEDRSEGASEARSEATGSEDAPWLTRTDGRAAPPPARPAREPEQRPAAGHRPLREPGRGEDIQRAQDRYPQRPWIALPIERREPPPPPEPSGRQRS
jgi:diguanylate cyclase (GGDEF)-like protein